MARLSVANSVYYAGEAPTHLIRGNVKVEGVSKPVHDVEQETHEDGLLYRLLAHSCPLQFLGVLGADLPWRERQFLQEAQGSLQTLRDGR